MEKKTQQKKTQVCEEKLVKKEKKGGASVRAFTKPQKPLRKLCGKATYRKTFFFSFSSATVSESENGGGGKGKQRRQKG